MRNKPLCSQIQHFHGIHGGFQSPYRVRAILTAFPVKENKATELLCPEGSFVYVEQTSEARLLLSRCPFRLSAGDREGIRLPGT